MQLGRPPRGYGSQMADNPCCTARPPPERPLSFMYETSASHIGSGVDCGRSGHTAALRKKLRATSVQVHADALKAQQQVAMSLHWRNERSYKALANEVAANPGTIKKFHAVPAGSQRGFEPHTEHFAFETAANVIGAKRPITSGTFARQPRHAHFTATYIGGTRQPKRTSLITTSSRDCVSDQLGSQRSGGEGVWRSGEKTFMIR